MPDKCPICGAPLEQGSGFLTCSKEGPRHFFHWISR